MHDSPVRETNRLAYIWVWLAVSIFGGILVVPVKDIFAVFLTHVLAFCCFFCAVFSASATARPRRWWLALICLLAAVGTAYIIWRPLPASYRVPGVVFALVNATFGVAVYSNIRHRRKEVLGALFVACVLGASFWPIGFLLAIPAVLYFDRWQDRWAGNNAVHSEHSKTSLGGG